MILPKNCNLRHSVPLRFTPKDFQKKGFLTNKQTILFKFFSPKSFVPSYLFMDRDMRKNHHQKQCKKSNSCSSMRFLYFRVEILYRWLGWSNFKILSFGKAHMVRKDPNFWYLKKKSSCQKSVQKSVNQPVHYHLTPKSILWKVKALQKVFNSFHLKQSLLQNCQKSH